MPEITDLSQIRRVVTGESADGKSRIVQDGAPVRIEGGRIAALWATDLGVSLTPAGGDPTPALTRLLESTPGCSRLSAMILQPNGETSGGSAAIPTRTRREGGWHATDTVDYI